MRLSPTGFWSYSRQDDKLSRAKLSDLRGLLLSELQQQFGRDPVRLFQDTSAIPHGAAWEREIRSSLDKSSFLIPIITPNFIQSSWCAKEVTHFLERERRLQQDHPELAEASLIFPLYLIDIGGAEPEDRNVLEALEKRQWLDFRHLRLSKIDDEAVHQALAEFAEDIRTLLQIKIKIEIASPEPPPEVAPEAGIGRAASGAEAVVREGLILDRERSAPAAWMERLRQTLPLPRLLLGIAVITVGLGVAFLLGLQKNEPVVDGLTNVSNGPGAGGASEPYVPQSEDKPPPPAERANGTKPIRPSPSPSPSPSPKPTASPAVSRPAAASPAPKYDELFLISLPDVQRTLDAALSKGWAKNYLRGSIFNIQTRSKRGRFYSVDATFQYTDGQSGKVHAEMEGDDRIVCIGIDGMPCLG